MIRTALYISGGSVLLALSLNMAHDMGAWLPVIGAFFGGALCAMGCEA